MLGFGRKGEKKAASYLKKKGYEILDMNYRTKVGEIDIIAGKGDLVVFVEVKARKTDEFGKGYEAVDARKADKIIRSAQFYFAKRQLESPCRFDVISIDGGEITHIENAFGA